MQHGPLLQGRVVRVVDAGASRAQVELVTGRAPSIVSAKAQPDEIMPAFISPAMPRWFGPLFFMTLLSAAMRTLSSPFHTIATSAGRNLYERVTGVGQPSLVVVKVADDARHCRGVASVVNTHCVSLLGTTSCAGIVSRPAGVDTLRMFRCATVSDTAFAGAGLIFARSARAAALATRSSADPKAQVAILDGAIVSTGLSERTRHE